MEDPIEEINQKVNEMQLSEDEAKKMNEMLDDLPPFFSDGSCFRDFLRGLGFNPDDVLNPDNCKPSTPRSGYSLIPEERSCCFRAIGPDVVKELVVPCADQALADFNRKHNTDYKLAEEGYNGACLRAKANVGCYDVHCNFTAKAETKPLQDGDFPLREFFADAELGDDCYINLISYSLIDYGKVKHGCEMCPFHMRHPAC